jgi:hypothetical protein
MALSLIPHAKLACPYCYETFSSRDIKFRCSGQPSSIGPGCVQATDSVLQLRMGIDAPKGPAFTPGGLRMGPASKATCPECLKDTYNRICPVCHSQLPVQFGMVGSELIAMAGASDSGKTVFMTVLVHELKNKVGDRLGAAIMDADDETRKRFAPLYEDELYTRHRMIQATQRASRVNGRVPPLVFRFAARGKGLVSDRMNQTMLSFFDTAGEDFRQSAEIEKNVRYLASGSGILLLLDPLQMNGARQLARRSTPLPTIGPDHENPVAILERVTEELLKRQGRRSLIDVPIAVVFTKIDALWHAFDEGSPLRKQWPLDAAFDDADSRDVHEQMRHLLRDWQGTRIDRILHEYYPQHRYFGVSALGHPPTMEQRVADTGIQPYRVTDPLLWLMTESGALPRTRQEGP